MLEVAVGLCRLLLFIEAAELGCTKCSFSHMKSSMVPMMLASCTMHSKCEMQAMQQDGRCRLAYTVVSKG